MPWLTARIVSFSNGTGVHARFWVSGCGQSAGIPRNRHKTSGQGFAASHLPRLSFPDKSGKMLVGTLIGVVCFLYAVYPDPFPELLVMLLEKSQQGKRFLSDTLDCVLTSSAVMNPRLFLIRS